MEFTGERFIPGMGGAIELEHLNRYYFVVNQLDLTGKTILDIASGEGYGSDILANYATKVFGVDISSEAIEHAREKYKAKNLRFIRGSVVDIPLKDHSVDVVVSFETIEHLNEHDEMMIELKRVLRKNGVLVISSPDKLFYSELPKTKNEFHIRELYYNEFKDLINKYFIKTIFYHQKIFIGSIIYLDNDTHEYQTSIFLNSNIDQDRYNPIYNVAISTDDLSFEPLNQVVMFEKHMKLYTNVDLMDAIELGKQKIRNTKTYKCGKFVLKPFSKIINSIK